MTSPAASATVSAPGRSNTPAGPSSVTCRGRRGVAGCQEPQRGGGRVVDGRRQDRDPGHDLPRRGRRSGHDELRAAGREAVERRVLHVHPDAPARRDDVQPDPALLRRDPAEHDDALGAGRHQVPLPGEVDLAVGTPHLEGDLGRRGPGVVEDQLGRARQVGRSAQEPRVGHGLLARGRGQTAQVAGGDEPAADRGHPRREVGRLRANDRGARHGRDLHGVAVSLQGGPGRRAVQRDDRADAARRPRDRGDRADRGHRRRVERAVAPTRVVGQDQRPRADERRRRRRDGHPRRGNRRVVGRKAHACRRPRPRPSARARRGPWLRARSGRARRATGTAEGRS